MSPSSARAPSGRETERGCGGRQRVHVSPASTGSGDTSSLAWNRDRDAVPGGRLVPARSAPPRLSGNRARVFAQEGEAEGRSRRGEAEGEKPKGRSRSRLSRRVIIESGLSLDPCREINYLPAGRGSGEGQCPATPGRRRPAALEFALTHLSRLERAVPRPSGARALSSRPSHTSGDWAAPPRRDTPSSCGSGSPWGSRCAWRLRRRRTCAPR